MSGVVAFLGHLPIERQAIDRLAWKYGWAFRHAASLSDVAGITGRTVIAVLFDPKDLNTDWRTALGQLRKAAPDALPVVCRRFSDTGQWPEMTKAGVFYLLHRPFALSEIQQCFGFIREAQRRHHERGLTNWPPPAPIRGEHERVAGMT